jgi:hypothetical protein
MGRRTAQEHPKLRRTDSEKSNTIGIVKRPEDAHKGADIGRAHGSNEAAITWGNLGSGWLRPPHIRA